MTDRGTWHRSDKIHTDDPVQRKEAPKKTNRKAKAKARKPKPTVALITDEQQKARFIEKVVLTEPEPLRAEGVGYYMDVQYAMLQKKLSGTDVLILRSSEKIVIRLPGKPSFNTNSARFNPGAQKPLLLIADVLREFTKTLVLIEGHADKLGDENHNQRLSEKRAMAVGKFLVKHDVTLRRLLVMGHGSNKPIDTNSSDEGRAQNRRVELVLQPLVADKRPLTM